MVINSEKYMSELISALSKAFSDGLLYVGLQGSYLRGEATENSDIDIMTVISDLTLTNLDLYRQTVKEVGFFDRSCGFICDKNDLLCWNPLELKHLLCSTKDYFGRLSDLLPKYSEGDELNYIKLSLNNLYHELCHGYIYSEPHKLLSALPNLFKVASFIVFDIVLYSKKAAAKSNAELKLLATDKDADIIACYEKIKGGFIPSMNEFSMLHKWCKSNIQSFGML